MVFLAGAATAVVVLLSFLAYRARARQLGARYLFLRVLQCVYAVHFRVHAALLRCRCSRRAAHAALPSWENPEFFQSESMLAPHTPLRSYDSLAQALNDDGGDGSGGRSSNAYPFPFDRRRPILERRLPSSPWTLCLDTDDAVDAGLQSGQSPGWHFKLFQSPQELPGAVAPDVPPLVQVLPDVRTGDWVRWSRNTIRVPGCWEMQGHDRPIYTNVQFPWLRSHIPDVVEGILPVPYGLSALGNMFAGMYAGATPKDYNPTAVYRRKVILPDDWVGPVTRGERRVVLALQSIASAARIFVNGIDVGYTQDSFTEAEVDITEALLARGAAHKDGHLLGLQVMRWSDGAWLEDQDHWWLSGIHRSVNLHCRPAALSIADFCVRTLVDAPYGDSSDATLEVTVDLGGESLKARGGVTHDAIGGHIRCTLFGDPGKDIKPVIVATGASDNDVTGSNTVCIRVRAPRKWSPEHPSLYTLGIELVSDKDEVIQVEVVRVGFRDVRIARIDNQVPSQRDSDYAAQRFFLLNNVPCVVAGANLHEHDARRGKTVSQETMLKDLLLMKQNNFNAVRMCHYPHAHRLYELCDELGLMVCDEANIETHGFALSFQLSFVVTHPVWEGALMQRVKNMAFRARNYASVVTWSLGNESGCGTFHEKAAAWIRAFDPTRTLQYEGGRDHGDAVMVLGNGRGSERVTDFVCPMYDSPNDMGAHARDPKETRPGVLCEYAHAMGNSSGGLHVYWDGFWEFEDVSLRSLQGGYMWDWVDQGLLLGADGLREGYGGDFGPGSGSGDAQFCLNGIVGYDRVPHPGMVEFKHCQSPVTFSLQTSKSSSSKAGVTIVIKNRYRDLDLSHLIFRYSVIGGSDETGEVVEGAGELELRRKDTGNQQKSANNSDSAFFFPGGDYVAVVPHPAGARVVLAIDLTAELRKDMDWAGRGHIVARDRLHMVPAKLRRRPSVALTYPLVGAERVKIIHDDNVKMVLAPNYRAGFDEFGNLVMLNQFLSKEAENNSVSSHCFMRAATDNDNGGLSSEGMGSSVVPFLKAADAVFGSSFTTEGLTALSYAATWLEEGLTNCVHVPMMQTWSEKELVTTASIRREGDAGDAKQKNSPNELFHVETKWTFREEDITITVRVVVGPALVSSRIHSIPRVGMHFALDKSFGRVQWHGCGPDECYPDRKRGSPEGVYESNVDKMHVSYTVPGECGGRADVRWVRLMRDDYDDDNDEEKADAGLRNKSILFRYEQMDATHSPEEIPLSGHSLIGRKQEPTTIRPAGSEGSQISVSRFSREELHRKKHDWQLRTSNSVHLHIDTVHMGLGGDNSWTPGVHQQYQINADTEGAEWNYRLTLIPE